MTLVETMSPAVTPSVDCVLNREWRSDTGAPRPELCSFSLAGLSQVKGGRLQEGVKCGRGLQSSVSISGDKDSSSGAVSEAGRSSGRFCCRIIFHRAHKSAEGRFVQERS